MIWLLVVLVIVCVGGFAFFRHQARTSLEADPIGALFEAAIKGHTATLTYLLDHGVDVNATRASAPGVTALHGAVMSGSCATVELLIHRGAHLDVHPAPDADGDKDTPLAHAVSQACDSVVQKDGMPGEEPTEMVELLLAAGADPEPGLRALQPYDRMGQHEQTPIAKMLRDAQRRRRS